MFTAWNWGIYSYYISLYIQQKIPMHNRSEAATCLGGFSGKPPKRVTSSYAIQLQCCRLTNQVCPCILEGTEEAIRLQMHPSGTWGIRLPSSVTGFKLLMSQSHSIQAQAAFVRNLPWWVRGDPWSRRGPGQLSCSKNWDFWRHWVISKSLVSDSILIVTATAY